MDEIKAKQQVVEKIREAENILVTVSDSPSVDALSAALGLSLLLDGQKKYATAIFSGETPPAIAFLEPEKTFDDTTDSLRDFIIALNKEKADHLRYKVEGDSVKIFITPYKTVISSDDLEYSQGDYNVELVIALGVDNQDSLDEALDNHGKILHDAAIITVTAGDQTSNLGGIDWHEAGASSLSEMVAGLAEALKEDKKKSLLDGPISTALLTGIVAETDRFSNEHTTSKAMTVAATLMAAGADQQLIATELQNAEEIDAPAPVETESSSDDSDDDGSEVSADGTMTITDHKPKEGLSIDHTETLAELDERILGEDAAQEKIEDEIEALDQDAEQENAQATQAAQEIAALNEAAKIQRDKEALTSHPADTAVESVYSAAPESAEPSFGGTLNATTEEAEEAARREALNDQNKTILSHAYLGGSSTDSANQSVSATETPTATPGSVGFDEMGPLETTSQDDSSEIALNAQNFVAAGERVIQPLAEQAAPTAAQSVLPPLVDEEPTTNAYGIAAPSLSDSLASTVEAAPAVPVAPVAPVDLGLPLPPPLPDFSQPGAVAPVIPLPPTEQPAILGDILNQDNGEVFVDPTANTVAAAGSAYAFEEPSIAPAPTPAPAPAPIAPPNPSDPAQYQIPPQQ